MQEICTPGSTWGDGYKKPCRLGEATASKGADLARLRKGYRSKACPYQPLDLAVGKAFTDDTFTDEINPPNQERYSYSHKRVVSTKKNVDTT